MRIGAETKVADLIKAYPQLEQKMKGLDPALKNIPIQGLGETTDGPETLEELARAANLEVGQVVDQLRRAAEQVENTGGHPSVFHAGQEGEPSWIQGTPKHVVDGTAMLDRGIHPLEHVNQLASDLKDQEFLLLTTNFKPMPLIFEMQKQQYQVYSRPWPGNPDKHQTFIRK